MGNTFRKLTNSERPPTQQKAVAEPVAAEPGPVLAQEPAGVEKPNKEELKPESTTPSQEPAPENSEVKAPDVAEPQPEAVAAAAAEPAAPAEPVVKAAEVEKAEADPTPESKEEPEPSKDAEPQPAVIEPPAPEQTEPEPAVEEPPVADTTPEPEPEPEPVAEPLPVPSLVPLICTMPPPEVIELNTEDLNQDLLPDPVICSLPPSEPSTSDAAPDETPDVEEQDQDGAAALAETAATEPPASEVQSEAPEAEATGILAQTVSDATEEVSGLLQDLALKGSDLIVELTPADVKTPDEACVAEMCD